MSIEIMVECACGATLDPLDTQVSYPSSGHVILKQMIRTCAACEEENFQRGYDARLDEEAREQADNPLVQEVRDVLNEDGEE